ncbi:MAG TPA: histidine phosphatase family protein [Mycobacteriales bacterium]|nr:histidine phosphatase family protein [Mycobacteriales bacterium]
MARWLYLVRHGEAIDGRLSDAGKRQARLVGQRLADAPVGAIYHSPLPRAADTAALIAAQLPSGVRVAESELIGDYIPAVPDPELLRTLPASYAELIAENSPADVAAGAELAAAALARFAIPTEAETREVLVTHNQIVGWFIRHVLDAPSWRWLGLNQCNGAISTLLFRPARPAGLVSFNELGHLPVELRWTGFPAELRG